MKMSVLKVLGKLWSVCVHVHFLCILGMDAPFFSVLYKSKKLGFCRLWLFNFYEFWLAHRVIASHPAATTYGKWICNVSNYKGYPTFRRINALSNPRATKIPTNLRTSLRDGFRRRWQQAIHEADQSFRYLYRIFTFSNFVGVNRTQSTRTCFKPSIHANLAWVGSWIPRHITVASIT